MLFINLRHFEFDRLQIAVDARRLEPRALEFARDEPRRAEMAGRPGVAAFHVVVGQDLDVRPPAVAFLGQIGFGEIGRRKQRCGRREQQKWAHIHRL